MLARAGTIAEREQHLPEQRVGLGRIPLRECLAPSRRVAEPQGLFERVARPGDVAQHGRLIALPLLLLDLRHQRHAQVVVQRRMRPHA